MPEQRVDHITENMGSAVPLAGLAHNYFGGLMVNSCFVHFNTFSFVLKIIKLTFSSNGATFSSMAKTVSPS